MLNTVETRKDKSIIENKLRQIIAMPNKSSQEKLEQFSNNLIIEYRELLLSFGGENSRFAKAIRKFCHDHLHITNLPEKLQSEARLNLYSLMLNKNHSLDKFKSMIGFNSKKSPKEIVVEPQESKAIISHEPKREMVIYANLKELKELKINKIYSEVAVI